MTREIISGLPGQQSRYGPLEWNKGWLGATGIWQKAGFYCLDHVFSRGPQLVKICLFFYDDSSSEKNLQCGFIPTFPAPCSASPPSSRLSHSINSRILRNISSSFCLKQSSCLIYPKISPTPFSQLLAPLSPPPQSLCWDPLIQFVLTALLKMRTVTDVLTLPFVSEIASLTVLTTIWDVKFRQTKETLIKLSQLPRQTCNVSALHQRHCHFNFRCLPTVWCLSTALLSTIKLALRPQCQIKQQWNLSSSLSYVPLSII